MNKTKKLVKVISGKYVGKIGWINEPNQFRQVIFYPIEEEYPCRICLSVDSVASFGFINKNKR